MKVDGYEVADFGIRDVIDKLCEADGSPSLQGKINYLSEAASMMIQVVADLNQPPEQA